MGCSLSAPNDRSASADLLKELRELKEQVQHQARVQARASMIEPSTSTPASHSGSPGQRRMTATSFEESAAPTRESRPSPMRDHSRVRQSNKQLLGHDQRTKIDELKSALETVAMSYETILQDIQLNGAEGLDYKLRKQLVKNSPAGAAAWLRPEIFIIGSINTDYNVRVREQGAKEAEYKAQQLSSQEVGDTFVSASGGKGSNEALVAATVLRRFASGDMLLAEEEKHLPVVSCVTCVGKDDRGEKLTNVLKDAGVDTRMVAPVNAETGVALVLHRKTHSNLVVPGANQCVDVGMIDTFLKPRLDEFSQRTDSTGQLRAHNDESLVPLVVVLSREIPHSANIRAAKLSQAHGAKVVLNVRPNVDFQGHEIDWELAKEADVLVLDRGGAESIIRSKNMLERVGDLKPAKLVLMVQEACQRTVKGTVCRPWVVLKPIGKRLNLPEDNKARHAESSDLVCEGGFATETETGRLWVLPSSGAYEKRDTKGAGATKVGGMDAFIGGIACGLALDLHYPSAILLGRAVQMVVGSSFKSIEDFARPGSKDKKGLEFVRSLLSFLPVSTVALKKAEEMLATAAHDDPAADLLRNVLEIVEESCADVTSTLWKQTESSVLKDSQQLPSNVGRRDIDPISQAAREVTSLVIDDDVEELKKTKERLRTQEGIKWPVVLEACISWHGHNVLHLAVSAGSEQVIKWIAAGGGGGGGGMGDGGQIPTSILDRFMRQYDAFGGTPKTMHLQELQKVQFKYDCFISYRVAAEGVKGSNLAPTLGELLALSHVRGQTPKVFLDASVLNQVENLGRNWREVFVEALLDCNVFVPLVSHAALERIASYTTSQKLREDNVLFEYTIALSRHALSLSSDSNIESYMLDADTDVWDMIKGRPHSDFRVLPVFVGKEEGAYNKFVLDPSKYINKSLPMADQDRLERLFQDMTRLQGIFVNPMDRVHVVHLRDQILKLVQDRGGRAAKNRKESAKAAAVFDKFLPALDAAEQEAITERSNADSRDKLNRTQTPEVRDPQETSKGKRKLTFLPGLDEQPPKDDMEA